jgi:glycosidase
VIQLDHSNAEQQRAMMEAIAGWVKEFDIDGFRADLAHLTPLDFWKKARAYTAPFKRDLVWLAETEEISYHEAFDITFTWEWMHATEQVAKGIRRVPHLLAILEKYSNAFPYGCHRMYFTSNHDENSWNGTVAEKYGDYVKNLEIFNFTYNSIPLIYSGQEIPDDKRRLFFDKDPIKWEALKMADFYSSLLALRKRNGSIISGNNNVGFFSDVAGLNVLAYYRSEGKEKLIVLLNFNNNAVSISLDPNSTTGLYRNVFTNEERNFEGYLFSLEPAGFMVWEKTGH